MIPIASVVRAVMLENPQYYEILTNNLANLSSLARVIQKTIEDRTYKKVNNQSIVVALSRLRRTLPASSKLSDIKKTIQGVTIKAPLCEFVFEKNTDTVRALEHIAIKDHEFMSAVFSGHEITVICSPFYLAKLNKLSYRKRIDKLAVLTVDITQTALRTPGVLHFITGLFFINNINIIEVVSTYTQFSLIIRQKDVQRATEHVLNLLNNS